MYFYKRITNRHVFVIVLALYLAACSGPVGEVIVVDVSDREEAVEDLLDRIVHAAKAQPDSAEARGRLAMAYEVNGYIPAAISTYQQANAIDQDQFNWWYFKAILLARSGECESPAAIESKIKPLQKRKRGEGERGEEGNSTRPWNWRHRGHCPA